MSTTQALSNIDKAIAELNKARKQLMYAPTAKPKNAKKTASKGTGHNLSPEGRERIAAAARKRWATLRKNKRKEAQDKA